MAIYLFSQILKFTKYSIKLIEKLSRRHLINSSDVFVIKGFTVGYLGNIPCRDNIFHLKFRKTEIFIFCHINIRTPIVDSLSDFFTHSLESGDVYV